ncbi:MAG: hypothetical protein ACE5FT_02355 [Candidatus Nanoarchaeia archaeon]
MLISLGFATGILQDTYYYFDEALGVISAIGVKGEKCAEFSDMTLRDFQDALKQHVKNPNQQLPKVIDLYKGMSSCFPGTENAALPEETVSAKDLLISGAQGYLGGTVIDVNSAAIYVEVADEVSILLTKGELSIDISKRYADAKSIIKCVKDLKEIRVLVNDKNPLQLALARVMYEESVATCMVFVSKDMESVLKSIELQRDTFGDREKTEYYFRLCDMAQEDEHKPAAKALIRGSESREAKLACTDWEYIT